VKLHHPWLSLAGGDPLALTPQQAGWQFCGLRVLHLGAGEVRRIDTGPDEVFVLPLRGGLTVEVSPDLRFTLYGRPSPFRGVTDFAYVGRDSTVTLSTRDGAEVALPSARCQRRLPPRYGPAEQVPVETRGAGPATRHVYGFGIPGAWDHADKLIAVELITPPGNWSSYPPHKHDATQPCPAVNEEIYFYRIDGTGGFGYHRTYTGPEHEAQGLPALDALYEVRDGDVVLVPYGYHGPCMAAPGYPMYYLNVMAGPGADRSMQFCDDPAHAWIRQTWAAR
jgi:5-deoxy-glucuronate isomerase